jgi:molybdate/tungstate transport system ATP-binding protein
VTRQSIDKRGIVLVTPQSNIPHMSVEKHLAWGRKLGGSNVDETYIGKVKNVLGISYSGKLQKLSLGMRERVSLATAVLSEARLILVDEAFSNIDNRTEFITQFHRLCSERSIDAIFTTQFTEDSKLADHSYIMEAGVSRRIS